MQTNSYLRIAILTGLFGCLFIPFIVTGSLFFPFISGKHFVFRIAVEIMAALTLILALRDPEARPKKTLLLASAAAFVVIIFLADLVGVNFFRSFWSNFERMEGFIGLIHFVLYFLIASIALNSEKLWTAFWNTSVGASVLMCFYGVFQMLGLAEIHQGSTRLDSTFGNATYLAVYLMVNMFICLILLYRTRKQRVATICYSIAFLFQGFILYFTATRGAILGLFAGLFLTAIIIAWKERTDILLRKISLGLLGFIVLFILGFFLIRNADFVRKSPVLGRFASISLTDKTTESRFLIWKMALQGVEERPILGLGQENFYESFSKFYDPRMYSQEQWFDRTHNVLLDWLIAGGVFGLAAYLSLFAAGLYLLWKNPRFSTVEKALFIGMIAAYFFQNLFVFDNFGSYLLFFSILAYIQSSSEGPSWKHKLSDSLQWGLMGATVFVLGVSFYYFTLRPLEAGWALIDALKVQGDPMKSLSIFKYSLSLDTFGRAETREQLLSASEAVVQSNQVSKETKQAFVTFAVSEMEKQISSASNDARAEVIYASFLNSIGQNEFAIQHYDRALELSPRKQTIYFSRAAAELALGKNGSAIADAKTAFDLEPEYGEARIIYAALLIYSNNVAQGKKLLTEGYGTSIVADDRLISAYFTAKDYASVAAIWKKRVDESPDDPSMHVSLGAAYSFTGQTALGVAEMQKALDIYDASSGLSLDTKAAYRKEILEYIRKIRAGQHI